MNGRSAQQLGKRTLHRGGAALLTFLFLAGNLGAVLHAAVERHARCPEHGHLIHIEDDAAQPHSLEVVLDAAESGTVVIRSTESPADGHDHEHCHICQISRMRTLPGQTSSMLVAPATAQHQPHTSAVVLRADLARYTLAPKTSPPV